MLYYKRVHKEYIMKLALTRLEQRILDSIKSYHLQYNEMPTIRGIGKIVDISSPGTIGRYVNSLVSKGYLQRDKRTWRGLKLISFDDGEYLPLMGRIAAGKPIEAISGENELNPNALLLGENRYALQVIGNSMIDAGIRDRDWVIIHSQESADDGQIVVALIDHTETTLKYLHHLKNDIVELRPANTALSPMRYISDRILIQGVLVAQMRTY
jgi:repressor LexA